MTRLITNYGYLQCIDCGELKHISQFYRDKSRFIQVRKQMVTPQEIALSGAPSLRQFIKAAAAKDIPTSQLAWFGRPLSYCIDCQKARQKRINEAKRAVRTQTAIEEL